MFFKHHLVIDKNDLRNASAEGASAKQYNSYEDNLKHDKSFVDDLYIYYKITNSEKKLVACRATNFEKLVAWPKSQSHTRPRDC